MVASNETVQRVVTAIRRHVDQATLGKIIEELLKVPGNKSFRDTVIKMKEENQRD